MLQAWDMEGLRWIAQPGEGFPCAAHWTVLACTPPPHVTVHCSEQRNKASLTREFRTSAETADVKSAKNAVHSPETKETSATLAEAEAEAEVDRCDGACSIGGPAGWCGRGIQPGRRASGARLSAWGRGGTSWQRALCIFPQCPLL